MSMRIRNIKIWFSRGWFHVVSGVTLMLLPLLCSSCKTTSAANDTVALTQLTADMIAKVKPYVRPKVLAKYIIEIGDIQEETMARPRDGREGYTQNIYKKPEGTTMSAPQVMWVTGPARSIPTPIAVLLAFGSVLMAI